MKLLYNAREVEFSQGKMIRVCTAEDLIIYKKLSRRLKDRSDAESVVRRQGNASDDKYIENWLKLFEEALTDSTFVSDFHKLRIK